MEWLRKLIENAKKKDDGTINLDELMKEINKEVPKHFIDVEKFNDISTQLTTANTTIADLKKGNKNNEELQKKVEDYEKEIVKIKSESETKIRSMVIENILNKELAGCKYPELVKKEYDLSNLKFDKDNNIENLDILQSQTKKFKEELYKDFYADSVNGKSPEGNYKGPSNSNNSWIDNTAKSSGIEKPWMKFRG